jgi:pimeloyl-CoA synthetase
MPTTLPTEKHKLHQLRDLLLDADDGVRDAIAVAMERSTHATIATDACWQDLSDVAMTALA